jgi:FtsP/CotA-like multicopper oxidase with cupredoxin domain
MLKRARRNTWSINMMGRLLLGFLLVTLSVIAATAIGNGNGSDAAHRRMELNPSFREPVALRSKDGVLEVAMTATQSSTSLNTVVKPVEGMLLYSWKLLQGDSDGEKSGDTQYPAPTLIANPGDKLILHVANNLKNLSIPDLVDPVLTSKDEEVPLTPRIIDHMPLNMHTHGLHVSPNLNSDNVMIEINPGLANTYTYDIPANHPEGLYWYHPHRHQYTEQQVYRGLAGMLVIGHAEGKIPKALKNNIPVRLMALQSNFVANRAAGMHQLTYPAWTQMINTWDTPTKGAIGAGSYQPVAAPVTFAQSPAGSTFKTNWFTGPLSGENKRGAFQFMPQNLISFTANDSKRTAKAQEEYPDHLRDYQFTINGQFQPELMMAPGQTEIWVIGNFGSQAYMNIGVRNTFTGKLTPLRILATDGNVTPSVQPGNNHDGTTYLLPSASRVAIAVTMPETGGLQLELPPVSGPDAHHTQPLKTEGILYTSTGDGNPLKGRPGKVSIDPGSVNWFDGFKSTPTQVLARVRAHGSTISRVDFAMGEQLDGDSQYQNLSTASPDVTRSFTIGGGSSPLVNPKDPNGFMYMFDGTTWPTTPVIHPRLNSIEEWRFINTNNDQHPIHIHVNDFEVTRLIDPVQKTITGTLPYSVDNFNVPAPTLGPSDAVIEQGQMWLRSSFKDFLGTFVTHCHRLDHEDNGLMMTVNVIPEISTIATTERQSNKDPFEVVVRDQSNAHRLGRVVPFPDTLSTPSISMADVDGDAVLDLIAGQGPGGRPEIVVYSGKGRKPFTEEIVRFDAFEPTFTGGVSVAAAHISGDPTKNNIITGSGPGRDTEIKVFSNVLPIRSGKAPEAIASFSPASGNNGVVVTAGMVTPGRASIITAPVGSDEVNIFQFPLLSSIENFTDNKEGNQSIGKPVLTTQFDSFANYNGPISLATGWIAAAEGGMESIVVGQESGTGLVRVYSWASNLFGQSSMYVESSHDQHAMSFKPTLSFNTLSAPASVTTTSTPSGSEIIVSGKEGKRYVANSYIINRSSATATQLSARLKGHLAHSRQRLTVAGG